MVFLILCGVMISHPCFSQQITFKGSVEGDLQGYNKIYMYNNVTDESDSTVIRDGKFEMKVPFSVPTRYMFYLEQAREVKGGYAPFGILVEEPSTIVVNANVEEGFYKASIKGSDPHALYEQFLERLDKRQDKVKNKLIAEFGESFVEEPDKQKPKYKRFLKERESLRNQYITPLFTDLIKQYPKSYASVFLLDRQGEILDYEKQQELFNNLDQNLQELHEGQEIADRIEGLKKSQLGQKVADFTLPNAEGESVSITDFRGEYVLIDFWASWCAPCIESFPHLRDLYKKYIDENFEILAIDIDNDKKRWYKAMKEHPNPWPQLYDSKDISSTGFAVTVIPATFLIDPEGKIIAKDLRGDDLTNKLNEIFEK